MANVVLAKWKSAKLSPLEILLDRQNPRINILPGDSESQISAKLIKYEDVIDLAKKMPEWGFLEAKGQSS